LAGMERRSCAIKLALYAAGEDVPRRKPDKCTR
jgi:hypothetical protein